MDECGQPFSRCFRLPPSEPRQTRKHDLRLLEPDIRNLGAVAGVPAQRRPLEPGGLRFEQDQDELQRVREADVRESAAAASATVALRESSARRKRP